VYEDQIVSSYERSIGQDLLGDELACLAYWIMEDTEKKGYFTLKDSVSLFEAFRFDFNAQTFNLAAFKKEFRFLILQNPGEFRLDVPEEDVILRFDVMRQIFLERGL
jgi:hypothetical protein